MERRRSENTSNEGTSLGFKYMYEWWNIDSFCVSVDVRQTHLLPKRDLE